MSEEYFPFKVRDKVITAGEYSGFFKKVDGEWIVNKDNPFVKITAIGATMFLASDRYNEHTYSKIGDWELYDPNRKLIKK